MTRKSTLHLVCQDLSPAIGRHLPSAISQNDSHRPGVVSLLSSSEKPKNPEKTEKLTSEQILRAFGVATAGKCGFTLP